MPSDGSGRISAGWCDETMWSNVLDEIVPGVILFRWTLVMQIFMELQPDGQSFPSWRRR